MQITSRGTHYSWDDIDARLAYATLPSDQGVQRAVFLLARGDTVANPVSTKRAINGPARVEFTRYPDGGIHTLVRDLPTVIGDWT